MVGPFRVRAGRESDRPFMFQVLELAAMASYPELSELGRITLRERLEGLFALYDLPDRRWYVAEDAQGAPQGGLWANPGLHPILEHPEAVIVAVAVLPPARKQGLARALIAHMRSDLSAHRISTLRLFVHPENHAARRLYEGLGFQATTLELTLK